ncbi:MAG: hypothetical protein KDK48_04915, partial [Chlamydiia bacterium]|nr:hypothetical protein [Chlamydiia bacterium]
MNIQDASGFSGPERFDSGSAADPGFVKFEGEFVEFATSQAGKPPEAHVTEHWLAQHPVSGFSEEQIKHLISAVVSQVGLENAKAVVEGFSEDEKAICERRLKVEGFKRDIQKDVWDTLERMSEEGLEHEADRIELATMAAEQDGSAISFYIHQLNISDQDALCKIAKKAAEKNPERTLLCIQNFRFSELEKLKEVFHSVQDPKYMNCFSPEATLETALIEIAKVNAEIHGHTTSMTFENYGIKDQEALVAIAKILARTNPLGTARSFRKFFIQREEDRIEIAKITASVSGSAATSCIKNYDIKDPSALVQIAKIAAAESGEGVSELIQNYSLSESARIEVAKIAAAQSGEAVSEYIQNYEIPESARIEVAKIAAAQSGKGISMFIDKYHVSESARIEIAKIAAAQDGLATSVYIKKYGITDQTALVEIAKIVAAQTGNFSLERFDIENEADRIAIAKIAAARDGLATCVNIKEYNINDPEALKEIFLCAFESDSESLEYLNAVIPEEVKDAYIPQNSPEHQQEDAIAIRLILENVLGRGEEDPLTQSLLKLRNP